MSAGGCNQFSCHTTVNKIYGMFCKRGYYEGKFWFCSSKLSYQFTDCSPTFRCNVKIHTGPNIIPYRPFKGGYLVISIIFFKGKQVSNAVYLFFIHHDCPFSKTSIGGEELYPTIHYHLRANQGSPITTSDRR